MRFLHATLAISSVCLCLALRPVLQEPPQKKPPTHPLGRDPMRGLLDEMQGAWRLTKMDAPTLDPKRRQEAGFMLVAGNYFSFELHFGWLSVDGVSTRRAFQSGTHRFELDEHARMKSSSVIGSAIDDNGRILFEQPGRKREYTIEAAGGFMRLTREDGVKFEFERLLDSKGKTDFYGRPLPQTPDDAGKPDDGKSDGTGDGKSDGKGDDKTGGKKDSRETPPRKD